MNKIKIHYIYRPLSEIGGDIIEIKKINESKIMVLVGDISGHGIPAAMIQVMIKTIINQNENLNDIEEILKNLNRKLIEFNNEMYLTCFLGIFDEKEMKLTYTLCGHPYPIIIKKEKSSFLKNNKNSRIIGIFDELNIIVRNIKIKEGEKFIIYTDGLTEAINHKKEEFIKYLPGLLKQPEIIKKDIEKIIKSIETFINLHITGQEIEDDYSIVGIEII